jgi:hypothetical protein
MLAARRRKGIPEMQILLLAGLMLASGPFTGASEPHSAPIPPPPPLQVQTVQPACVDARDSADYVPGVDAYGSSVAPADLPGSTADVEISSQVYAELRSSNPQLRGVGVVANLPGIQTRPPCPQSAPPASAISVH